MNIGHLKYFWRGRFHDEWFRPAPPTPDTEALADFVQQVGRTADALAYMLESFDGLWALYDGRQTYILPFQPRVPPDAGANWSVTRIA